MILHFNEREIDTDEYNVSFDEGTRVDYGDATFADVMYEMDITEDEVEFSRDGGEDGLPEGEHNQVDITIFNWINLYNHKVLEPYNDKETNILINDMGEDGIQLIFLYHHDLSADSDYNDEQFELLSHLFEEMSHDDEAYKEVESTIRAYESGELRTEETYVLLKLTFTDKHLGQ